MRPASAAPLVLRLCVVLTLAVLISPIAAGLAGTLLPAFGYWPALGGVSLTLAPWRTLLAMPGLWRSVGVSAFVGFATTTLALGGVVMLMAAFMGTRGFAVVRRLLSPLLAVPHVALAFGLAFTIAPSGLIFRLLSPWATGLVEPPDLLIVNDAYGLSLTAGLILKEIPFLFLMTLAALPQTDAVRSFAVARSLGYRRMAAFVKVVMPRLYPQLRLPVLAVLAYGLSVVDVALLLGPTTPPTLAVTVLRLADDPDLSRHFQASAGAVLQLALVLAGVASWMTLERLVALAARHWMVTGSRHCGEAAIRNAAPALAALIGALVLSAFLSLGLWSVAAAWRFPDVLPRAVTLDLWRHELTAAAPLIGRTLLVGAAAVAAALLLTLACLENEVRRGVPPASTLNLIYIPLIAPQITFLAGTASLMIALHLDGNGLAVGLAHLVFVLPYVFLSLSGPWRAYDARFRMTALLLGASPWRALFAVRLPMLSRAILVAAAVGFAVSVGQYLSTLLIGAGRFTTVTTEAVALASGGDRRLIGVYALMQAALPFLGFSIAIVVPSLLFRHRQGLRDG
ncbi:putative thiamine transport system permease protein [Rhizobiales bacterium GAS188]|nr:putative thiamine transport system permease protein [Rhizobiales bacterium GAS188]